MYLETNSRATNHLSHMYCSGNRFRDLSFETDLEPFLEVRDLGLDETFLTWDDARTLPSL